MKDEYCSYCGAAHSQTEYPRECSNCENITYSNPLPVAVCVQPVLAAYDALEGLAIAKRAIEPRFGTWNLLTGHVEDGETIEEAACREWREESGVEHGRCLGITGSYANGKGHVLVAVRFEPITLTQWSKAVLCVENSDFGIWYPGLGTSPKLGFPIHNRIAHDWWINKRTV